PMLSSKSFRPKNWRRFFAADADVSTPCPHAIPALDHHRDPAFPAKVSNLRERDEGLRARASTSRISRAWNRPTHRRRTEISKLDGAFSSNVPCRPARRPCPANSPRRSAAFVPWAVERGMALHAAPHLPSFESEAATAHRRGPLFHPRQRVRGVFRVNRAHRS